LSSFLIKSEFAYRVLLHKYIPAIAVSNIDLQSSRRGLADGAISTEGREHEKFKFARNYS